MKIGIIVHSQTGNTYSVATKLKEKLVTGGHTVKIEQLKPIGDVHPGVKNLQFETTPEVGAYDALVFAAPVQAFSLSPVMNVFLTQLASLYNKKVACFVTMGFPYPWMGGSNAIRRMQKICISKNVKLLETGIINWSNKRREEQINELVEKVSGLF